MIIIGIDPGLVNTGYGIISIERNNPSIIDFGIIQPNSKEVISKRLFTIFSDVSELMELHKPDVFSIEEVFYSKNFKSALMLGHAWGAAFLAAAKYKFPVFENV